MDINAIKKQIDEAQAGYLAIVHTAPAAEVAEASRAVKGLRAALSAAITEGADACPDCGVAPHGLEQPAGRGGVEYEIGCLHCGAFEHTDGTTREHRVRGGMFPRHAVEAWNVGPAAWLVRKA